MGVKIIPGGDQLCWALLPNEPHLPPVPPLGVKTGPGGGVGESGWGGWLYPWIVCRRWSSTWNSAEGR